MLEFNQTQLATDEDKAYGIDRWAAFFAATTWEEIRMLAKTDPKIEKAACYMMACSENDLVARELRERQEAINEELMLQQALKEKTKALEENVIVIQKKDAIINDQAKTIEELIAENIRLKEKLKA